MYALMAVGLTLVYGLLRILHIAHAAVYALGAYVAVIVANATGAIGFGVDALKVRYLNFAIGAALAGLAGALIGVLNNFVEPTMGFVVSYKALAIIVVGGLGSLRGTLIASLALGMVESYGTIFVGRFLDRDAIAFLFLIAVLIARPRGLGGVKTA